MLEQGQKSLCTKADGIDDLQKWHERLRHVGPSCCKLMVDPAVMKDMVLRNLSFRDCKVSHLAKQKRKYAQKCIFKSIRGPDDLIYADLLFPPRNNGTRFSAVLIILYHVKTIEAAETNPLMQRYTQRAECQVDRKAKTFLLTMDLSLQTKKFGGGICNGAPEKHTGQPVWRYYHRQQC